MSFLLEDSQEAEGARKEVQEPVLMWENPDQEAIVESLKSICNVLLHSETGLVGVPVVHAGCRFEQTVTVGSVRTQAQAADLQLIKGVTARLKRGHELSCNHEVWTRTAGHVTRHVCHLGHRSV